MTDYNSLVKKYGGTTDYNSLAQKYGGQVNTGTTANVNTAVNKYASPPDTKGALFPYSTGQINPKDNISFLDILNQIPGGVVDTIKQAPGILAHTVANFPGAAAKFGFNLGKSLITGPADLYTNLDKLAGGPGRPGEFSKLVQESQQPNYFTPQTIQALKNKGINPTSYNPSALTVVTDFVQGNYIPNATHQVATPSFLQKTLKGDFSGAAEDLVNDPFGQVAPLLFLARAVAYSRGYGSQFDQGVSNVAQPIAGPIETGLNAVGNAVKGAGQAVLGAQTGSGPEGIKAAARNSPEFQKSLSGQTTGSDIVDRANALFDQLKDNQRQQYQSRLAQISQQEGELDSTPIYDKFTDLLNRYKVRIDSENVDSDNHAQLNFKNSTIRNDLSAQRVAQQIFDTLNDNRDHTAMGLDTLKQQVGNTYIEQGRGSAIVSSTYNSIKNVLNDNVPGYEEMTSGYSEAEALQKDITGATGIGGRASTDTAINKISSALKQNNQFRIQMLQELGGQEIIDQIAGYQMKTFVPRGLVGKTATGLAVPGTLLSFFTGLPAWPLLLEVALSSPHIVASFVQGLGLTAAKTQLVTGFLQSVGEHIGPGGLAGLSTQKQNEPNPGNK